jgi:RNA polymerase sigma-70 factor (ECF subfamily)
MAMTLTLEVPALAGLRRPTSAQTTPKARPVDRGNAGPDDVLISRISNGDHLAMRVLYARHHVRIYRFVLRVVRDRAMAEDLTSDVFLDVWRQAGRFEARSAVTTWLLRIAHFKALSALRRKPHEELTDTIVETVADGAATPDGALLAKDETKALRGCVDRLSADHRAVIELVYFHGKSVEQVADMTGVKRATIRTRMFHARRQLAAMLAEMGVGRG